MINSDKILEDLIKKMNIIDVSDIPSIDLYMDQVTTFMDKHLKNRKRYPEDKIITKTMINNYSKNELLPAPIKKRYTKEHIILLLFIYYFKNILSINDIKTILSPLYESHFDKEDSDSLTEIYRHISDMENALLPSIKKDITSKINASKNSFSEYEGDDKEFLQLFSLISSLSFDVYLKKQMIEGIIDSLYEDSNNATSSDKDSSDSKKQKEVKPPKQKNK